MFEAIHRFNHGVDEALCGAQRLKKAPDLSGDEAYILAPPDLELTRCRINRQFLTDLVKPAEAEWKRAHEEYDRALCLTTDHDVLCHLMRIVERERKEQGLPPLVQFLTPAPDEQPANDQSDASPAQHHPQQSQRPNGPDHPPSVT